MIARMLPVVVEKDGRVDYALAPATRLMAAGAAALSLGVGFVVPATAAIAAIAPRGLWWAVAVILVLATLSEDRWSFDPAAGLVRRRFGLLFVARSWSLPISEVECLALRSGKPGEGLSSDEDTEKLAVALQGLGRGPWCALVLRLVGGRSVVLAAARRRDKALRKLGSDGEALSARSGIPFVRSTE